MNPFKLILLDIDGSVSPQEKLVLQYSSTVIQLGVESDLRLAWYLPLTVGRYSHELDLLCQGKVEVYPKKMRHSVFLGRLKGDLPCARLQPGLIMTRVR